MNRKGFFITELVVVVSVVLIASIALYTYTNTIIKYNEKKERYNSVDGIYRAKNIRDYLERFSDDGTPTRTKIQALKSLVNSSEIIGTVTYDEGNANENYLKSICTNLNINVDNTNPTNVIWFLKKNFDLNSNPTFTSAPKDLRDFVNWVSKNNSSSTNNYRLIISYTEDSKNYFATIEVE